MPAEVAKACVAVDLDQRVALTLAQTALAPAVAGAFGPRRRACGRQPSAILDDARTLPQCDRRAGPAFTGGAEGSAT
jgi:hypothetical protein